MQSGESDESKQYGEEKSLPVEAIWPEYQTETWSVINSYFRDTRYFITKHHIDSYNIFIQDRLPKTVRQNNPISSKFFSCDTVTCNYPDSHTVQVRVYLGCEYLPESEDGLRPAELLNNGKSNL